MTGFLGRIAARASGREAGISPRVPSRFEGVERSEPVAVEQAAEIPATPPEPTRPMVTTAGRQAMPRVGTQPERPAASPRVAADDGVEARPAEPVRVAVPPEPRRREPASMEEAGSSRGRPAEPARATAQPSPPPAPAAPDLLVVPAAPAAALARNDALVPAAGPVAADTSPREPDVVHVSIGRVDVRGSVAAPRQPAPRQQTRQAAPSSSARLSLQDYLRGQREAR